MKRLDVSETIFKILSYSFVTLFALACLYPFIYTFSVAISGPIPVGDGSITFLPKDIQFKAIEFVVNETGFWNAYSNTIFLALYGTIFSMFVSITGAYVLANEKLLWRRQWNFLLVFTMWFNAGMAPQLLNYKQFGIDSRWGIVVGLGMNAFNIILLRNYFAGVPKEIEEAAIVDGANEFQILIRIYIPMSKAALATVTLFYALSRWNGYFWAMLLLDKPRSVNDRPLQVYLRRYYDGEDSAGDAEVSFTDFKQESLIYAMIVFSIIPIIFVYPYIQKYFARGVNVGGVKE